MKKIFISLLLIGALFAPMFADSDDDVSERTTSAPEKTIGFGPGLRISVLGLEPTFAVDIGNLELEAACALSSGVTGKQFGFAPSFSVAYNSNPFEKGMAATFGLEYMYLTPAYTAVLADMFDDDSNSSTPGIHALSLFYRGGFNFNHVFGLLWRIRMPLVIGGSQDGESFNMNITNLPGFFGCLLVGVCTISIGVKFEF
ncbi:MAG: hypothetical protein K6E69_00365 [Treponema sp.]|uniref:hypothetical protein n=1 Tax=Treponema sp. TaxID=166 RepID=UPI00298E30D9|nr:hypothetical protein [Treponema sp.]MCR5385552.1 hypothetical protein [Treponema sp.]